MQEQMGKCKHINQISGHSILTWRYHTKTLNLNGYALDIPTYQIGFPIEKYVHSQYS
jgi:hypothetical protein